MFVFFKPSRWLAAGLLTAAFACRADTQLNLLTLGAATQTGDGTTPNPATMAVDGNLGTFSQTPDVADSFWEFQMLRKVRITRIDLVAPSAAPNGLVLRIFDLRDQTVFQATVSGVTAGSTWSTNLPAPVYGRVVHFALENGQASGVGDHRVAISEVRIYGDPSAALGPLALGAAGTVSESSTNLDPTLAIDASPNTTCETLDQTDSFWLMTFNNAQPFQRLELVNTTTNANASRLQGLTVRVLDGNSNSLASTTVPSVAAGANWIYSPPTAITNARYLKIGLENGALNGQGNHIVSLAEVNVYTTTNLGAGKPAYMTRDSDTLPPNSNVNDDNYATTGGTTGVNTHDFFWEMNLGQPFALYGVRVAVAGGQQPNLTNASLIVLDGNYNPVYFKPLSNALSEVYDTPLPAPVIGQYVRISFEYAQRSGGIGAGASWFLDMKEVQAYGRPTNEIGLTGFNATQTNISSGGSTTLQWQESDLNSLNLYPNCGPVGSNTLASGAGSLTLSPANSTEYTLVGSIYSNTFPQQLTITVNGQNLPPQVSEFVADNQFSLDDGNGNASDWIELHNPNNTTLDIGGCYLSDDPAQQTKWQVPSGTTISPHGHLIVFADSASTNNLYDPAGYLHANFGLNNNGESLVLTAADGVTVLDGITNFPAQTTDLAYGRTLDGQWKFLEPTPGAPNVTTNYDGWLAPLDFDHKRGWYTNAFTLAISNANPGATVYWSTNGYEPTNVYTGPLTVANTVGVRASVKEARYKSPRIKTHTFLFLNDMVVQSQLSTAYTQNSTYTNRLRQGFLDLPVLAINVPPADPKWSYLVYNQDRPERAASVEFFLPDGSNIQQDCGVIHLGGQFGTGTGLYAKKTWQLNFKSDYGASYLNFPLFAGFDHGIQAHTKFKELDIHAGNQDQGGFSSGRGFYMSHAFANDSMLDMGDLNPHSRFVNLFTNGVYMGQFCINERLTDAMLAEYLGGSKSDYLTVKGNDNTGTFGFIPGVADGPDRSAWDFVRSNMSSYATIKSWVDVTNQIDYMLMWQWGNAEAEFRSALPRTAGKGGFKVWLADADGLVRQQSGVSGQLSKNDISDSTPSHLVFTWGPGWIFSNLLHEANPDFKTLLADRVYKHFYNNGAMTPAKLQARLDARMAEITNSMVDECARWGSLSTYDPVKWQADAQYARANLFPFRNSTLISQMRAAGWYPSFDPPLLSQYGGSVSNGYTLSVTAGSGTIYYTLDGSDPRLPGGGISPNAIACVTTQTIVSIVNLPLNSTWRYFNTNAAPAGSWTNRTYDDSAWPGGATPMGYPQGDDGVTFPTILNYGADANNKWISYYFRKSFVVTNLSGIATMNLGLNRDDGAVIYLNGTELMRDNMPAGPVSYGTFASAAVSGANETNVFQFSVPANLLLAGTNVLAVEVHQDATNSSDIHFNLSLAGTVTNNTSVLSLTLTNATTFNARVWDGTNWSALASANFILAPLRQPNPGDLLISELNYHPPDSENYEFVELYNTTSNQLDLTGVQLTGGITYLFPNGFSVAPNGFALAVRNLASFAARYQATNSPYYYPGLNVAGPYSGKLSNSGDTVILTASNGVELCEVNYGTDEPWPARAGGNGSSLELASAAVAAANGTNLVNLNFYLNHGQNWRSSPLWGGSPGRFDTVPQAVVINELNAHTHVGADWLELKNLTAIPVDISGGYLSDNLNNVFKYYLPPGTVVPANGFLVLSQMNIGFAFSEHGEDVVLAQTSGTNILRFIDALTYEGVASEESLGRYTRSDGVVDFTELRSQTPGAENDLPRVGPVVMSEIMYHPATNHAEYIEIVNIAQTNVLLYDPLAPTNTWILTNAVEFVFPTNQILAPGAAAIICATNPAAFQLQYNVPTNVTVYGPYSGQLNNAGEHLKLEHPGDRETNGFLPFYRMDHVLYAPDGAWPTQADSGNGISLERVTLEGYGNDPINWQASSASNGTPGIFVGNRQPSLSVLGSTTVNEGDTVSLTAQASDFDQPWQTLSLSAQNLPDGSSFDTNSGAFSWPTVETNGPGVYNLQFIVADNGVHPMTATQNVAVTVLEVNQPPVLQAVADTIYPAQLPFALNLAASDPDWPPQALAFGASGLPPGLSLNAANGHISGSALTPGVYPIGFSVTDNGTPPLTATNGFTLTITPPFAAVATFIATNNATRFSFQSLAGANYDVEYTLSLSPADWQLLRHITNAPGGLLEITNASQASQCFLRVLWTSGP